MKLLTEKQFMALLTNHRAGARSERELARDLKVNWRMLNKVLNGASPPGNAIPAALGYEPVTMYRRVRRNGKRP
jgi:hypothetical protein